MDHLDGELLYKLFSACLRVKYDTVEDGASFAMFGERGARGASGESGKDKLYIFFEKSNGTEDWINNLDFYASEGYVSRKHPDAYAPAVAAYKDMSEAWYCHSGFMRVWRSIIPYVEEIIFDEKFDSATVVGYSHGAALALLCHEYIWFNRPDMRGRISGYGFGCPRVIYGNVGRAKERWRDFYVIRNLDDLVTHLPPRILGYRHVGKLVSIGKAGKYSPIDAHREQNYLTELDAIRSDSDV
jgi:hypothetical protein